MFRNERQFAVHFQFWNSSVRDRSAQVSQQQWGVCNAVTTAGQAVPALPCHGDRCVEKAPAQKGEGSELTQQTGKTCEVFLYALGESVFNCFLFQLWWKLGVLSRQS